MSTETFSNVASALLLTLVYCFPMIIAYFTLKEVSEKRMTLNDIRWFEATVGGIGLIQLFFFLSGKHRPFHFIVEMCKVAKSDHTDLASILSQISLLCMYGLLSWVIFTLIIRKEPRSPNANNEEKPTSYTK